MPLEESQLTWRWSLRKDGSGLPNKVTLECSATTHSINLTASLYKPNLVLWDCPEYRTNCLEPTCSPKIRKKIQRKLLHNCLWELQHYLRPISFPLTGHVCAIEKSCVFIDTWVYLVNWALQRIWLIGKGSTLPLWFDLRLVQYRWCFQSKALIT